MSTPDKCQHCGADLIQGVTNQWLCGSWLHAESGAGRQTDLCRERAARQEVKKALAATQNLAANQTVRLAKLATELAETRRELARIREAIRLQCGVAFWDQIAGQQGVTPEAKEGK